MPLVVAVLLGWFAVSAVVGPLVGMPLAGGNLRPVQVMDTDASGRLRSTRAA